MPELLDWSSTISAVNFGLKIADSKYNLATVNIAIASAVTLYKQSKSRKAEKQILL